MDIARLVNSHVDTGSFNNPTAIMYWAGRAQHAGTAYQAEFYVQVPPSVNTTIGLKHTFLGATTCNTVSMTPSQFPTADFMTVTFNNYDTDPDCYFDAGDDLIFTISGNPATATFKTNGYKDPFFPTQSTYMYLKVSSVEPFITQDSGNLFFGIAILVFIMAMLLWGRLYNTIK